jgi:hypothetical protein
MNLTYISSLAHSAYLQNYFKRVPRSLYLSSLDGQLADPYFRNEAVRRSWHQNYPVLNFLNAHYRETFNGTRPTTDTPFVSGLIIGTAAIINIAEVDAARGWPENAVFLQKIPAYYFQGVGAQFRETVKTQFASWKAKYPCFRAALDQKLTYEQFPKATEFEPALFTGVFAAIGWLLATAESEIPSREIEDID